MVSALHIELDAAEAVYRPGDTVRGRLVLTLSSEQHPRSITLHAVGTEFTNWGTQPSYIARTHPLDQAIEVWKAAAESSALPAGTHAFRFEIVLPPYLPPSFDGMLTEIGYGIRAKVDLPRHVDMHAEAGFVVLASVPAVVDPPAPVEAHDASGREIKLVLPRSVYRLGETVEGTARVIRAGEGRARRLTIELLSRERGGAQGIWAEDVEREAESRVELEHVAGDMTYPFTFKVPDWAVPTFRGEHSALTWHVRARLDVARMPDLIAEVEVTIVEPS